MEGMDGWRELMERREVCKDKGGEGWRDADGRGRGWKEWGREMSIEMRKGRAQMDNERKKWWKDGGGGWGTEGWKSILCKRWSCCCMSLLMADH